MLRRGPSKTEPDASSRSLLFLSLCTMMSESWRTQQSVSRPDLKRSRTQHNRMGMAPELCNLERRSLVTVLAMDNLFLSLSCVTPHPGSLTHTQPHPHTHSLCFLLIYRVRSSLCWSHSVKYAVECCCVECSHPESAQGLNVMLIKRERTI